MQPELLSTDDLAVCPCMMNVGNSAVLASGNVGNVITRNFVAAPLRDRVEGPGPLLCRGGRSSEARAARASSLYCNNMHRFLKRPSADADGGAATSVGDVDEPSTSPTAQPDQIVR